MNVADYVRGHGEGMRAILVVHRYEHGYPSPIPCVRVWWVPSQLPFNELKKRYENVVEGYFSSIEEAIQTARDLRWKAWISPYMVEEWER